MTVHRKHQQPDGVKVNRLTPLFGIHDTTCKREHESEQICKRKFVQDVEKKNRA